MSCFDALLDAEQTTRLRCFPPLSGAFANAVKYLLARIRCVAVPNCLAVPNVRRIQQLGAHDDQP
jgi:hypothetical protein